MIAQQGTVTALPYADKQFDVVWCANTLQYLNDEELMVALEEFRRAVRPGGGVAVKDIDLGLAIFGPADPALFWHLLDAGRETVRVRGFLRGRELRRWLQRAGFATVWQRATLSEHRTPLATVERQYFGTALTYVAGLAETFDVPAVDLVFWHQLKDPEASEHLIHHPEFYYCEGHYMAAGRVPERTSAHDAARSGAPE